MTDIWTTELQILPHTTWVGVRGYHPGSVVQIRRVTERAVYYKVIREGAGSGPRPRKSGSLKTRFDREAFLLNYRPHTRRDWMLAAASETEPEEGMSEHVNGRLHPDEQAIAEAIRRGDRFHDVQREYHVHGRVLSEIIAKYEVPYQSTRQAARRDDARPEPEPPAPERLHAQEDEIVELLRSRAASFQEVLRTYHVRASVLKELRDRHGIPAQTEEERREKHRVYYYQKKARLAEAAAAAPPQAEPPPEVAPIQAELERLNEGTGFTTPQLTLAPARRSPTWQVKLRTTLVQTFEGASYQDAANAALAANPGAEILGLVRVEDDA